MSRIRGRSRIECGSEAGGDETLKWAITLNSVVPENGPVRPLPAPGAQQSSPYLATAATVHQSDPQ